jgi:hypothetical protein
MGPYPRYVRALLDLRGGTAQERDAELGPYAELVGAGTDTGRLAAAVHAALEHHVAHAQPSNQHVDEFGSGPEHAFPVEVVALARIRERSGLPFPDVDHELWRTPLAQTRGEGPWPEHALLARGMRYAESVTPPHPDELLKASGAGPQPPGGGWRRWLRKLRPG